MPDGLSSAFADVISIERDNPFSEPPLTADYILLIACGDVGRFADKINVLLSDGGEEDEAVAARVAKLNDRVNHSLQSIAGTPATTVEGLIGKASIGLRFACEAVLRSVAADLIGRPPVPNFAAALTPDPLCSRDELLERYNHWLYEERKMLCIELWGLENLEHTIRYVPEDRHARAAHYHPPQGSWRDAPPPSSRAAAVMAAGGVCLLPDKTLSAADIRRTRACAAGEPA